ncbi:MAG TPA: hypothetical protein VGZ29_13780 [Terriglobia bacterium]|nr:hypothetical protein [Terriglobia bacterium]
MKSVTFWALDATVLFALSLVYLHQGYHRKNAFFAVWLCNGVTMQLIAAWGLAAGPPSWMPQLRACEDILTYALTAGVLITAALRRDCPVNRTLLCGVGAMVALNVLSHFMGLHVQHPLQVWLRNIAFFGPALFLLITFSNLRLDALLLWITAAGENAGARWAAGTAMAAVTLTSMRGGRRR